MPLVPGLECDATSLGFAVIDLDFDLATGTIHRLGARIFPEARDPKSKPLTQGRRQARRQHFSGRDFGGVSDAADDPADDADDRKATSARDRTGQVSKREAPASRSHGP